MSNNVLFEIPEKAMKKVNTQEEIKNFIQRLFKHGVEALLKDDITEHLVYPRPERILSKIEHSIITSISGV